MIESGLGQYIHHLELFNFKSYKGKQTVGPFKKFSAIIGPNGAGKSNLMDAISFVLGVRASHLRGAQIRDMIYRVGGSGERASEAYVQLAFHSDDEETLFKRHIPASGNATYSINGKSVSWDAYEKELKKFSILVKARNFLVFQGDVESIASKSPLELTKLIEKISGSAELKAEYDALLAESEKAKDQQEYIFQKKKTIITEKKQYKAQKDEAEEFNRCLAKYKKQQVQYYLFQLYDFARRIELNQKLIEHEKEKIEGIEKRKHTVTKKLSEKKKKQAAAHKNVTTLQRNMKRIRKELNQIEPDIMRDKGQRANLKKKLQITKAQIEAKRMEYDERETEAEEIQEELKKVQKNQEKLEEEIAKKGEEEKLIYDEDEYNARKEEAGRKTNALVIELEKEKRKQQLDLEREKDITSNLDQLSVRLNQLQDQEDILERRIKKVEAFVSDKKRKLAGVEQELKEVTDFNENTAARKKELEEILEGVQSELKQCKVDIQANKRERESKETIESLMRVFPGVYGRMIDLVEPVQRYQVAMTVAMGRNMDAIVVDDSKTAVDCVEYLREQRRGVATFLPLNGIKVKTIDERLKNELANRTTGAKLIIDVLKYDPSILKAVLYSVGNTIVCETMKEAKSLCFSKKGARKSKVVTVQGTLIRRSGLMTGGPGGVVQKAKRWSQQKMDASVRTLKQKQDKYLKELAEVGRNMKYIHKQEQLETEVRQVEFSLKNFDVDLQTTEDKLSSIREEKANIEKKIASCQKDLEEVLAAINQRDEATSAMLAKIHKKEDKIFADFSEAVGCNIREYEQKRQDWQKESTEKKLQLETTLSLLNNQYEYETERNAKLLQDIEKLEQQRENDEAQIKKLKTKISKPQEKFVQLQEQYSEVTESKKEAIGEMQVYQTEIKSLKEQLNNLIQESNTYYKVYGALEIEIDQIKMRRHQIYQDCKVEQVHLPRIGEATPESDEEIKPMSIEYESEEMQLATQTMRDIAEKEDDIEIDFAKLSAKLKKFKKKDEVEEVKTNFINELQSLNAEMQKIAPNLKAISHLQTISKTLITTEGEFKNANTSAKEANSKFQKKKEERYRRFMDCFDHISKTISDIYKALTQSDSHVGGVAYLNVENPDEPYLHGIKYNATPPLKRFCDIDRLSGGEKTVAALALVFAIHSYQPSPFFVLDEIDAALDKHNIAKVVRYITSRLKDDNMQFIVISLKPFFYSKADALVGIYRDQDLESSGTLTLSLEEFET